MQLGLSDNQEMTNPTSEYDTSIEPPSIKSRLNVLFSVSAKRVHSPVVPSIRIIATMMDIEPSPSY